MTTQEWTGERLARACLSAVVEPGSLILKANLVRWTGAQLWERVQAGKEHPPWLARAESLDPQRLLEAAERLGMRFIIPGDPEWPQGLDDLVTGQAHQEMGGAPVGLWARGPLDLAEATAASIGIVGSRAATGYGQDVAMDLAHELARTSPMIGAPPPWTIVSGGAYGIDIAAHRGALAAGGATVCVQACGLDQLYPKGNSGVLSRILAEGVMVSERSPGSYPTRPGFLARNRLIAALSTGVVVVEASARSGALSTANWAYKLYRPLMAVPGPVTSSRSAGPNQWIRDTRAILVRDADDIRCDVGPIQPDLPLEPGPARALDALPPDVRDAYEALPSRGSVGADEVAQGAGLGIGVALVCLGVLEDQGMALRHDDGTWSARLTHLPGPGAGTLATG
ncbi:DNA-processing protein DprA [Acidipropionibacterium jensenii]|uniref:DNA-processing protein DprA n=1 Tax=Acidipropionibacterium jensenii TaxID=1749 RepID=UPI00214B1418|nr:DNA-processing protein DprA [Acidipropionibacterium jensenii]